MKFSKPAGSSTTRKRARAVDQHVLNAAWLECRVARPQLSPPQPQSSARRRAATQVLDGVRLPV